MKKAVSLLLALMLLFSMNTVNVYAADTWGGYTVVASPANAEVGDTVEVTVYLDDCSALSGGIYNVDFFINLSDGLEFVSGSAEYDAAAFEKSTGMAMLIFNEAGRDGVPYKVGAMGALAQGYTGGQVEIISFECKVVAAGTQTVTLTSPELTDIAGNGKLPKVTPATISAAEKHVHNFGTAWEKDANNHWNVCSCGEKANVAAHTFEWKTDKEATCSATGEKHEECTVCGAKRSEGAVIPKTTHTEKTVNAKEATCSEEGYTGDVICSVCETVVKKGTVIPKTAHTEKTVSAKEATCSAEGYTGDVICSVCNTTIKAGTVIPKTAHNYKWVIDKEATADATGLKHEECADCGAKRNEGTVIPKKEVETGHTCVYGGLGMDEQYHWTYCSCGAIEGKAPHNFVDADTEGMVRCVDCGYEKAKAGAAAPTTGDDSNLALWIGLMVVAAGAVTAVAYGEKKRM